MEKENAGLVQQLPKIDQVEVMDNSSYTVEELEMQETEVEDIDADDAGNSQLVVEYVLILIISFLFQSPGVCAVREC